MSSQLQIDANRKNAQKCTGPRTPEGKAISSQNALKTGLDAKSEVIRLENRADYDTLIAEYYERFNPTVPEERCLVDALVKAEWLGRRYYSADAAIWEREFNELDIKESRNQGLIYVRRSDDFARVDRRINSAQRNFSSALKQLLALQSNHAPEPTPIPGFGPVAMPDPAPPPCDTAGLAQTPSEPIQPSESALQQNHLTSNLVSILTSPDPASTPVTIGVKTPRPDAPADDATPKI